MLGKKMAQHSSLFSIVCLSCLVCACTFTEKALHGMAVAASHFKSPVVIKTGKINDKIDAQDCEKLKNVSFAVRKGIKREKAIKSVSSAINERFDTLDDLKDKDTMVFVCLSGGGSRASAMSMHSLSILEKSYNRMRKSQENQYSDMYNMIDGYSTVSGGSIYASTLALYYMRNSFLLRQEQIRESFIDELRNSNDVFSQYIKSSLSEAVQQLITEKADNDLLKSLLAKEINTLLDKSVFEERYFKHIKISSDTKRFLADNQNIVACNRLILQDAFRDHIEPVSADVVQKKQNRFFQDLMQHLQGYEILTPHGPLRSLGATSALAYFFTAGGLPFLSTIFTDFTYMDILSAALNVHHGNYFYLERHNLGKLPKYPRFFFNSTCIETGTPFVFTQSMLHLPEETDFSAAKPLRRSLTLENIYSSPKNFPLNYAAMASAAFPVFTPMSLRKYKYEDSRSQNEKTIDALTLGDGGLFDNSGMSTVTDLTEYLLKHSKNKKRVILIYIDAGIENYNSDIVERTSGRGSEFPLKLQSPILNPIIEGLYSSTDVMHYLNKQRAIRLALEKFSDLKQNQFIFKFYHAKTVSYLDETICSDNLRNEFSKNNIHLSYNLKVTIEEKSKTWTLHDVQNDQYYLVENTKNQISVSFPGKLKEFIYFPISTFQLASWSADSLPGKNDLFQKVVAVPTDFVISAEQESLMSDAAEVLITANQKQSKRSWDIGPRPYLFSTPQSPTDPNTICNIFRQFGNDLSPEKIEIYQVEEDKFIIKDISNDHDYLVVKDNNDWKFYGKMQRVYHLDVALSYALIRAQSKNWYDLLKQQK